MIIVILLQKIDFDLQYSAAGTIDQAGTEVSLFGTGERFRIDPEYMAAAVNFPRALWAVPTKRWAIPIQTWAIPNQTWAIPNQTWAIPNQTWAIPT